MQSSSTSSNPKAIINVQAENVSTREKTFTCGTCSYASIWECNLAKHQATHEDGEELFRCEKCTKFYNRKQLLYLHFKQVPDHRLQYTETLPQKCDRCSYACEYELVMEKHYKTHKEGELLLPCGVCSNYYNHVRTLNIHYEHEPEHNPNFYNVYGETEPEDRCTLICTECNYATDRQENLARHVETHTEGEELFECGKCTNYYNRKELLYQHYRRVKEHRPTFPEPRRFVCEQCSYASNFEYIIVRHKKTHVDDEELIDCGVCANYYNSAVNLAQHYKKAPEHRPSFYEGME